MQDPRLERQDVVANTADRSEIGGIGVAVSRFQFLGSDANLFRRQALAIELGGEFKHGRKAAALNVCASPLDNLLRSERFPERRDGPGAALRADHVAAGAHLPSQGQDRFASVLGGTINAWNIQHRLHGEPGSPAGVEQHSNREGNPRHDFFMTLSLQFPRQPERLSIRIGYDRGCVRAFDVSRTPLSRWMPMIPLPIDSHLDAIEALARTHRRVVLCAPPGSGKTTRVAPRIASSERLGREHRSVVMLQPRRVAARASASRIADENGWTLGREVGYQIRNEKRMGPETILRVVTEGILTRQIVADPFLDGVGAVIFDEFTNAASIPISRSRCSGRPPTRFVRI